MDARCEQGIFEALGLEYKQPEQRNCEVTRLGSSTPAPPLTHADSVHENGEDAGQ